MKRLELVGKWPSRMVGRERASRVVVLVVRFDWDQVRARGIM